jgi:glucosamine kinase
VSYVIGVDGGGTHTRAAIVDERGLELGPRGGGRRCRDRAHAGGGRERRRPRRCAAAAERACVDLPAALLWAGLSGPRTRAGPAGGERAPRACGSREAGRRGHRRARGVPLRVPGRARVSCSSPGPARSPGRARPRAGSAASGAGASTSATRAAAYAIGLGAVRAVVRAEDGREGATVMRDGVLRVLALADPVELIPWAASAGKAEVAGLVPIVVRAASNGDPAASQLMDEATRELTARRRDPRPDGPVAGASAARPLGRPDRGGGPAECRPRARARASWTWSFAGVRSTRRSGPPGWPSRRCAHPRGTR